jgi:hypothetical protein
MNVTNTVCTKPTISRHGFVKNSYTEFNEKRSDCVGANTKSQAVTWRTDVVSTHTHTHTHIHFVKNACYSRCCTLYYELTAACLYIFLSAIPTSPISDTLAQFRYGFRLVWPSPRLASPQSVTLLFCPLALHIRPSCLFRIVLSPCCTMTLLSPKIPRTKHVMLSTWKRFSFLFNYRKEYKFEASQL